MDENTAQAGLAAQDQTAALQRQVAELQAQVSALLQGNVVDAQFRGEPPTYQLNARCVLDDTLYEPGTTIEWWDPPNLSMVPLNEPADRVMRAYIAHIESCGREVAMRQGRAFPGVTNDRNILMDFAMEFAKLGAPAQAPALPQIKMPEPAQAIPAMPHLPDAQAAKRRSAVGAKARVVSPPSEMPGPVANKPRAKPRPVAAGGEMLVGDNADLGPALVGRMAV